MLINAESKIKDIILKYPECIPVFSAAGFGSSKEELIEKLGESLMLKTALKVKGINEELFLKMLHEKISDGTFETSADEEIHEKLNFIGYTYCPLKLTFRECFLEVLNRYKKESNDHDFKYYVPSGCGGKDPYEDIWKADNIDELPEIIASVGLGDFFRREFYERFVKKGYFKAVSLPKENEAFVSAGLVDPDGFYTVYSVFPLVLMVDTIRLGNLPEPKKWSDLLDPAYENNIIIGASHGGIHEDLLLYIHKEHGDEGIMKLSKNIKDGLHASQMSKLAGTNSADGAAVYVIPWMFAKSCPRTEKVKTIWPEDGAITTPNYMLVKENAASKYKIFIDFLMGADFGQKSADNYFPVANGEVDNRLPEGAALKWLGWDYIKSHSMDELKQHVTDVFKMNWGKENKIKEFWL